MADQERRVDNLENEMKLVKGEIKRTLVDLRAVVMKAGSPFQEGAVALAPRPAEAAPVREAEVVRVAAVAEQPAAPAPAQASPGVAPAPAPPPMAPGMPPMVGGAMPFPGGGPMGAPEIHGGPTPHQEAPPGQPTASRAPREAEAPWTPPRDENDEGDMEHTTRERPAQRRRSANGSHREESEWEEMKARRMPADRERRTNGWHKEPSVLPRERWRVDPRDERNGDARSRRRPLEHDDYDDDEEPLDLPEMDEAVNVNLIANLMRWVATTLECLGMERLDTLMDLYLQSGHYSPGLKDLVSYLVRMQGDVSEEERGALLGQSAAQRSNDLMLQLHGILTAHCTPPQIPRVRWDDHRNDDRRYRH